MGVGEAPRSSQLISASRRTDLPRYFGRWFANRRREGYAEYQTAFGVAGRVSLKRADVLGYLFWTRNAQPFQPELHALLQEGVPVAFQFTLNGYGPDLEPNAPPLALAIDSFRTVAKWLPGSCPTLLAKQAEP